MADKKSGVNIQSKAETIENDLTKKQEKEAQEIEKRRQEARQKADQAKIDAEAEARRIEEENKRILEEKRQEQKKRHEEAQKEWEEANRKREEEIKKAEEKRQSELLTAGAAVAGGTLLAFATSSSKSSFLKGLVCGILIGILGCYFLMKPAPKPPLPAPAPIEEADVVLENNGVLGHTSAEFEEAVLEGASEHQELIVMEQPLSITTTITKAGLGNFAVFSKMKDVTYYGTGVYTVDLSEIDKDHIRVDEAEKVVHVTIPHAVLQYVNTEVTKTEFEDTEKGMLALGDIKLTAEETKELQSAVYETMHERLDQSDLYESADRFAILKTWEIFQPLVTAVSPEYKVEVEFGE